MQKQIVLKGCRGQESRFAFIWDFAGNLNGRHETLICLNKKPHSYSDPGTLWHIYLNHTHIHTRT